MNKIITTFLLLFLSSSSFAQEIRFDIIYSSQKSGKDSASSTEKFYLGLGYLDYSYDYTMANDTFLHTGSNTCKINENKYVLIAHYIDVMGINKDFTFVPAEAKENDFFEYIKVSMNWDGVSSKIELMGYKYVLKREDIYKKIVLFIETIRYLTENCGEN